MTGEPTALSERDALLHRLLELGPALRHRFRATVPAEARLRLQETMEDVTASQLEVLMLLHQSRPGLSMHELAEAQAITPSSATQLVDRLVRLGLVERLREEEDRRLVRVQLSGSARQRFEEMLRLHLSSLAAITEPLSDEELRTGVGLLARITQPAGGECSR
ncbi:MAG: MarR family transcriptional regulator [Candidatus Dormibacteria bacterium]